MILNRNCIFTAIGILVSFMKQVLMILTSHRLDCLRLCVDLLFETQSIRRFDRVVWLMNGVVGRHRAYIDETIRRHPGIPWDTVSGPRGRGALISNLENECVKRHPDSLYFKIDEDTFVCEGWVERLAAAYEAHRHDPRLSLITPVIANNSAGACFLMQAFPELGQAYDRLFHQPRTPYVNGPVATYPQIGEWMTRQFLNLREANAELATAADRIACGWKSPGVGVDPDTQAPLRFEGSPPHLRFGFRFSINCICYDYRHWQEIGGVPVPDEIGWGDWIQAHNKYIVLATDSILHHYSFFMQQDWLDRTNLLEDIRISNTPHTLSTSDIGGYYLPRFARLVRQAPRAIQRKIKNLF